MSEKQQFLSTSLSEFLNTYMLHSCGLEKTQDINFLANQEEYLKKIRQSPDKRSTL